MSVSSLVYLSTYPPRRCGIATFTRDLRAAVGGGEVAVVRRADDDESYPGEVIRRIDRDTLGDYAAVAAYARVPLMPVVKADAYGHGAAAVSRRLVRAGATMLAVAYPEEGLELRAAGVDVPVIVLAGFAPAGRRFVIATLSLPEWKRGKVTRSSLRVIGQGCNACRQGRHDE